MREMRQHLQHYQERSPPKEKTCTKQEEKEVDSPRVVSSYASTYNGVDRKDRDTSDWTIRNPTTRD
jgi:hypothetical protein